MKAKKNAKTPPEKAAGPGAQRIIYIAIAVRRAADRFATET
jgi:hypothetical protein